MSWSDTLTNPLRAGHTRLLKVDRIEAFNGVSHLLGAVLALAGTAVLMFSAVVEGDGLKLASFLIYGLTLCLYCSLTPDISKQRTGVKLERQCTSW